MSEFVLHYDDEPRGAPFDEPREDDLWLDKEHEVWRNEDQEPVCGSLTSSGGKYKRCKKKGKSNGRCRFHGGDTPTGQDHGAYKHGKYSKDLPSRLKERYEQSTQDEQLTNLREEIALIETRIHSILTTLDAKNSAAIWGEIEQAYSDLQEAQRKDDSAEFAAALNRIESLIDEGAKAQKAWAEVGSLVETKRKLVDSERRREKALQAYVPLERFSILLTAIDEIIRRHIDDPSKMQAIAREIQNTTSLG